MTDTEQPSKPTISIYQNADHVAGILQQIHRQPLVTSESREQGTDSNTARRREIGGGGESTGSVGAPVIGKIGLGLSGNYAGATDRALAEMNRRTLNFEYSQAYYLYEVRSALRQAGHVKTVGSVDDAKALNVGDFIEFTATFSANEITALLDILSPDLIAAIARFIRMNQALAEYQTTPVDEREAFVQTINTKVAETENLARIAAGAARTDFRTEKTREFYGTIGDGNSAVTAITICDNSHFVVEDEDRILDGEFTVLGKVTSRMADDVPVLERNKILDRIRPEAVDDLFEEVRQSATIQGGGSTVQAVQNAAADVIDVAFASRIDGPSFRVVPVAIFI